MNKLGINLWNWVPGLGEACLGLPAKVADMGFTAIELPMTVPDPGAALEQEIRSTGLAVSLCAALGAGRDLSSFDAEVRRSTLQYLTQCLQTGERLGATVLAGPLYAGGGKRHALPPDERSREWELAVTGLQELARRARECGMTLALEPLCRYRTSVVNTVDQALRMIDDIGSPNVGLHYDTFHACLEEADLLSSLSRALQAGKVLHFHACANNRGAPGQGLVPWNDVLRLLQEDTTAATSRWKRLHPVGWTPAGSMYTPNRTKWPAAALPFCAAFLNNIHPLPKGRSVASCNQASIALVKYMNPLKSVFWNGPFLRWPRMRCWCG